MEKHGIVSIDFENLGGPIIDLKVPFHLNTRALIEELCCIYGYEKKQENLQLQSFKASISQQFIPGNKTLIEANVKDGEILRIIK